MANHLFGFSAHTRLGGGLGFFRGLDKKRDFDKKREHHIFRGLDKKRDFDKKREHHIFRGLDIFCALDL